MTAAAVLTASERMLASQLTPRGFRRNGHKLVRVGSEVVSLIEFQPSRDRAANYLTYAVNYGVFVLSLFPGSPLEQLQDPRAWRSRIGHSATGTTA
jgi:hypothetical protein